MSTHPRGPIPAEHLAVCAAGQGAATCRYLTTTEKGWSCAKTSALQATLDARVAAGKMKAEGDNCPGWGL